jgi:hypothetical protein
MRKRRKKYPEVHTGHEAMSMEDTEKRLIDKVTVEALVSNLNKKDRDTIILWASGYSLANIAEYINEHYEDRPPRVPLTASAIGPRIQKILRKLRKYAKVE